MEALARWVGIAVQALVIGGLLTIALLELLVAAGADTVFHYQGF
jgi:hypothetical protein